MPVRRLRVQKVGEYLSLHSAPSLQYWSNGTSGQFLAFVGVESGAGGQAAFAGAEVDLAHRLARVDRVGAQAVVDALEVAATDVRSGGGSARRLGDVAAVVVGLGLPVVRHRVAARVDDVVELPAPGLLAPGGGERGVVARLAGLVAEDRHGPGRVGHRIVCSRAVVAPAGQLVQAEEVLGAVGRGDLPVLADTINAGRALVGVGRTGELFDLLTGVGRRVPALGTVVDQLGALPAERQTWRCRCTSTGHRPWWCWCHRSCRRCKPCSGAR